MGLYVATFAQKKFTVCALCSLDFRCHAHFTIFSECVLSWKKNTLLSSVLSLVKHRLERFFLLSSICR